MMNFSTLGDVLAAHHSSEHTICYINGETDAQSLSFADIYGRALGLLRHFQSCGASAGCEMILLVDSNDQFVQHRAQPHEFEEVARSVRKCVNEHIGIVVAHVIPIARMPKTTSGKIQRYLLAESYVRGDYAAVLAQLAQLTAATPPAVDSSHEIERALTEICHEFLEERPPGPHDNIFELGTSSLTLAQIYQRIDTMYPGRLQVTDFFDYLTIAELAAYLRKRLDSAQT